MREQILAVLSTTYFSKCPKKYSKIQKKDTCSTKRKEKKIVTDIAVKPLKHCNFQNVNDEVDLNGCCFGFCLK